MTNGGTGVINNFEDLDYEAFQYIMDTLYFDRNFHDKQREFFQYMFKLLRENTDTNYVSCAASRCGIGKSTFIQILIRACIYNKGILRESPIGLIIATDVIKRLEDYVDDDFIEKNCNDELKQLYIKNKENIAILKSDISFKEQLESQKDKPILLMSTQRYFMLGTDTLKTLQTFYHKGKRYLRSKIIFDEPPYFTQTVEINIKTLNDIDTALKEGLDETVSEKDWIIDEYTAFSNRLQTTMKKLESIRNDRINLFWKDENTNSMTTNDDKFFELLEKYKEKVAQINPDSYFNIFHLRQLQAEGGFFSSSKLKTGQYNKKFSIMIDNRDKFFLGSEVKTFVLDATCDIDPKYEMDYVKQINCQQFNVPLSMIITNVNMTTSKNAICKPTTKAKGITTAISDYLIQKVEDNNSDMLVATYSNIVSRLKKGFPIVLYFGNMKGLNGYRNLTNMAHIGLNRYSQMAYYFLYCASSNEEYTKVRSMSIDESIDYFDKTLKDNAVIDSIMYNSILADFEQNIFRLAIRNLDNKEAVHVWAFYNNSDNGNQFYPLSFMMKTRYERLGVVFEEEDAPQSVKNNEIMFRKPNKDNKITNAQKVLMWWKSQPIGKEFEIKALLSDTGLSNKQLQKVKEKNSSILKLFTENATEKRGHYRIS